VYYDRHVRLDPANQTFMSIHDTYYRARWANQSGAQIGALLLADLERRPNALAVVLDDPGRLVKMDLFQGRTWPPSWEVRNPLAREILRGIHLHLLHSPDWQTVRYIDSPYGRLRVLRHGSRNQTLANAP